MGKWEGRKGIDQRSKKEEKYGESGDRVDSWQPRMTAIKATPAYTAEHN